MGVNSDGLPTTQLPAAKAGAIFQAAINNGKFQGIICPATPSFYSNPTSFEELASTVVDRVLTLAGFEHNSFSWGEKQ